LSPQLENRGKITLSTFDIRSIGSFILLICMFLLTCSGHADKAENAVQTDGPALIQDTSFLSGSNGLIVEQRLLEQPFKNTDIYKIKYLSDSLEVVGFVVKPAEINRKYPVIIFNRGGNREFGKIGEKLFKYFSFLASRGYVVVASQYRGNDGGEGREEFGGGDVNDVLNLFPLIGSLPFTDPDKVVMLGYSRGGMMTCLAIKNGAPIKAAAVVGGISDLLLACENRPRMKRMLEKELIGTDREEYLKRSAASWPEKLTAPLLILHGSEDWRSNVAQATGLAAKLDSLGYEYRLEVFDGGDHGLNTHRPQRNKLIFDWFAQHLDRVTEPG
jgi:dipeptidyl aminopeptidase/acylaminoacyl peptidase